MTEREIDVLLRELPGFRPVWRRSRNGNLFRKHHGRLVVVFRRPAGGFGWVINDAGAARFSGRAYGCEADAVAAVAAVLKRDEDATLPGLS